MAQRRYDGLKGLIPYDYIQGSLAQEPAKEPARIPVKIQYMPYVIF